MTPEHSHNPQKHQTYTGIARSESGLNTAASLPEKFQDPIHQSRGFFQLLTNMAPAYFSVYPEQTRIRMLHAFHLLVREYHERLPETPQPFHKLHLQDAHLQHPFSYRTLRPFFVGCTDRQLIRIAEITTECFCTLAAQKAGIRKNKSRIDSSSAKARIDLIGPSQLEEELWQKYIRLQRSITPDFPPTATISISSPASQAAQKLDSLVRLADHTGRKMISAVLNEIDHLSGEALLCDIGDPEGNKQFQVIDNKLLNLQIFYDYLDAPGLPLQLFFCSEFLRHQQTGKIRPMELQYSLTYGVHAALCASMLEDEIKPLVSDSQLNVQALQQACKRHHTRTSALPALIRDVNNIMTTWRTTADPHDRHTIDGKPCWDQGIPVSWTALYQALQHSVDFAKSRLLQTEPKKRLYTIWSSFMKPLSEE